MDLYAVRPHPSQLTSVPKVLGVLSIIFASLVLLFGLGAASVGVVPLVIGSLGKDLAQGSGESDAILAALSSIYGGIGVIGCIQVVMSGWLLAVGIGQLRYKRWARRGSLLWSGAALVGVLALIGVSVWMIGPGYERLLGSAAMGSPARQAAGARPDLGALGHLFGSAWAGMFVFFYAPWPILLLAFFTRERVREAMIA